MLSFNTMAGINREQEIPIPLDTQTPTVQNKTLGLGIPFLCYSEKSTALQHLLTGADLQADKERHSPIVLYPAPQWRQNQQAAASVAAAILMSIQLQLHMPAWS